MGSFVLGRITRTMSGVDEIDFQGDTLKGLPFVFDIVKSVSSGIISGVIKGTVGI